MLNRLWRLPRELLVALAATIRIFLLNVQWALSQTAWKIDTGFATLPGAIVGFAIVSYQARRGFANLIRSQANQAQLDRAARLHKAELEQTAKETERKREKELLLAAVRAEIAAIF